MVLEERKVVVVVFRIGGDEGHSVEDRLADEHAVEGVFVMERQISQQERCLFSEWQGTDAVAGSGIADVDAGMFGETQFADRAFDRDFGRGNGTQKNHVAWILNGLSAVNGKLPIIGDEPKEVAGIEEEDHDA